MLTDQVGRPSQDPIDRAVDRRAQTCASAGTVGRSTGRSTGPESVALCIWAVDRRSTGPESPALYIWAVDRDAPTVGNPTVGGRPAGRPQDCQTDSFQPTASFLLGL